MEKMEKRLEEMEVGLREVKIRRNEEKREGEGGC